MSRTIVLAAVAGAHGITGEVRLKLFTDDLAGLKRYRQFNDGRLTLTAIRPHKAEAIARFAGIADRNAAEALRGTQLSVPRDALPPLPEGEFYHSDLIGLPAITTDGRALGTVIAIQNYGAGDLVEIKGEGVPLLVPMTAEAVPEWDAERLLVDAAFVE